MKRPLRSSTVTGVVTRFVSTMISSSWLAFDGGGGGGGPFNRASSAEVSFFTVGFALAVGLTPFMVGARRVWANAVADAATNRQRANNAILLMKLDLRCGESPIRRLR